MSQAIEFICKLRHLRTVRRMWGELKGELISLLVVYILCAVVRYWVGIPLAYRNFDLYPPLHFFSYLIPTFYSAKVLIAVLRFFAKNREHNQEFMSVNEIVLGQIQADPTGLRFTFRSIPAEMPEIGWKDDYGPCELSFVYTSGAALRTANTSDLAFGGNLTVDGTPDIHIRNKPGDNTKLLSKTSLQYKWLLDFTDTLRLSVSGDHWNAVMQFVDEYKNQTQNRLEERPQKTEAC